jgi:transcriptional regulator with XRE-family HTH domain
MKTLSQLLAEQRQQQGISQAQLSARAGISQAHIAKIEFGESKPTMPVVFRICKALDLDPLVLSDKLALEFRTYMNENFPAQSTVTTNH